MRRLRQHAQRGHLERPARCGRAHEARECVVVVGAREALGRDVRVDEAREALRARIERVVRRRTRCGHKRTYVHECVVQRSYERAAVRAQSVLHMLVATQGVQRVEQHQRAQERRPSGRLAEYDGMDILLHDIEHHIEVPARDALDDGGDVREQRREERKHRLVEVIVARDPALQRLEHKDGTLRWNERLACLLRRRGALQQVQEPDAVGVRACARHATEIRRQLVTPACMCGRRARARRPQHGTR